MYANFLMSWKELRILNNKINLSITKFINLIITYKISKHFILSYIHNPFHNLQPIKLAPSGTKIKIRSSLTGRLAADISNVT